jgi:hypothetical protein
LISDRPDCALRKPIGKKSHRLRRTWSKNVPSALGML